MGGGSRRGRAAGRKHRDRKNQAGSTEAGAPALQVSEEAKALITALLQKDPKARLALDKVRGQRPADGGPRPGREGLPPPSQVLEHPWIVGNAHPSGFPEMDA